MGQPTSRDMSNDTRDIIISILGCYISTCLMLIVVTVFVSGRFDRIEAKVEKLQGVAAKGGVK